jgi:hypothetical protein
VPSKKEARSVTAPLRVVCRLASRSTENVSADACAPADVVAVTDSAELVA